jgi:anti-anti-sigma factor
MDFGITDGAIDERTHVIEPHGEIDLATVPLLKARVDAVIESGVEFLIVDLVDVHFIDSSGLGIMLSAHGRLEAAGGMLVIACADDLICRVFTIAGVRDVLNVQKTRRDALAQVGDYARAG